MNLRQQRYNELVARDESLTDEELTERVQLFYELHPEHQWWNNEEGHKCMSCQEIWGVDTSCYDS